MSDLTKKQRTSHEKLRSDHIDMLNMLQKFQDENEQLKTQVSLLQKQLGISDSSKEGSEADDEPQPSSTQLLAETHFLTDELKKLKDAMKKQETEITKKVTANMNKTVEDLTKQIYKYQKEGKEAQDQIKQLENKVSELTTELKEAQSTSTTTTASPCIECIKLTTQSQTLQSQLHQLQEENHTLKSQLHTQTSSHSVEDYRKAQEKVIALERQCLSINQQYLHSCEQASGLHAQIHRLEMHIKHQEHEKHQQDEAMQALEKQVQAMKDIAFATNTPSFSSPNHPPLSTASSFSRASPSSKPTNNNRMMTVLPNEEVGTYNNIDDDNKSVTSVTSLTHDEEELLSFRFQDYLRLKRENKELKMRIAEMTSHSSHRSPATTSRVTSSGGNGGEETMLLRRAGSQGVGSMTGYGHHQQQHSSSLGIGSTITNTHQTPRTNSLHAAQSTGNTINNNNNKLGKSLSMLNMRR